jgi:hypothetical protein
VNPSEWSLRGASLLLRSLASRASIRAFPSVGDDLAENPEKAFSGNGNRYKYEARIAELERLLGQEHAENELLKKPSP